MTVPVALERVEKLVDLGLGQVLANPVIDIRLSPFLLLVAFRSFRWIRPPGVLLAFSRPFPDILVA
jgi:hypothetical protein